LNLNDSEREYKNFLLKKERWEEIRDEYWSKKREIDNPSL
jgi:hypothetical protein